MQNNFYISFILWFIFAIIIIGIYTYTIGSKVDKIYSILDTERVNVEIDTNCN